MVFLCERFFVGSLGVARSPEFAHWEGRAGLGKRELSREYMQGLADRACRWVESGAVHTGVAGGVRDLWLLTRAMGNGDVSARGAWALATVASVSWK